MSKDWITLLIFYILTVVACSWKLRNNQKKLSAKDEKIKGIESRVEELEKLVKSQEQLN
ncbi:MAG TPA: hypothetical protein VK184_10920 [Nostocaceae cyanobacterium]|nr:hypothetical protein [Nostocaceae cyanobacterium]